MLSSVNVHNLTVKFDRMTILDDLSLSLFPGQIVGLVHQVLGNLLLSVHCLE